jgi:hypothetical protein
MVDVFVHHTRVLCKQLQRHVDSGEPVEMQNLLSRFTLDTFLEVISSAPVLHFVVAVLGTLLLLLLAVCCFFSSQCAAVVSRMKN